MHKWHRFWISTKNWTFWHNEISINLCLYFSHKIQLYLFRKNKQQLRYILFFENDQFLMLLIQSLSHVWTSKSLFGSYGSWNLRWVGLVVLIFVFFVLWFILVRISETVKERSKISSNSVFSHLITLCKEKITFLDLLYFNRFFFVLFHWCYDPFLFFLWDWCYDTF